MEPIHQKKDHVVIVTSDAADAKVKKYRIKPRTVWTVVIIVCIIIGIFLGFVLYADRVWSAANRKVNQKIEEYQQIITELEDNLEAAKEENSALKIEMEGLQNKVTVMSDTINQMVEEEEEMTAQLNKYSTPTLLPITGSATIEEITDAEPMNIFNAAEGAVVVATAVGTVAEVAEDDEFGCKVVIDHGNGYITIYRNKGNVMVATGDAVSQGGTLFIVESRNTKLGYQIMKDGAYVNPSEIMEIKG